MATQTEVKTVTDAIGGHYARQATPEVWAEVDELRKRVATMEAALVRALTDVGCLHEPLCPHWVEWHNVARQALLAQADRNPEGHDPAEGHGRNDESPVRDSECAQPQEGSQ